MGRPTNYSPTILPLVRCAATFGATAEEIAEYIGVPERRFYEWRLANPALQQALKRGRDQSDERVVDSLYQQALKGNVVACLFWLKNRRPSEWRDVQNINADVGHYILSNKPMTEDEWIETRTKVIEAKRLPDAIQDTDEEPK